MILLACILAAIFASLAGLHVYWGFGGRWAGSTAIPKRADGTPLFSPGIGGCFVVAGGLTACAYFCLWHVALAPRPLLPFPSRWLILGLAGIFTLRTFGDFRYFGLFRRINGTDFSALDRKLYTPLCATLAASLLVLALGGR